MKLFNKRINSDLPNMVAKCDLLDCFPYDLNNLIFFSSLPSVPSQHRSVPPSPKILKRSLAMEMIEQICVLGRDQSHSLPLLQSLFKAIDFV